MRSDTLWLIVSTCARHGACSRSDGLRTISLLATGVRRKLQKMISAFLFKPSFDERKNSIYQSRTSNEEASFSSTFVISQYLRYICWLRIAADYSQALLLHVPCRSIAYLQSLQTHGSLEWRGYQPWTGSEAIVTISHECKVLLVLPLNNEV